MYPIVRIIPRPSEAVEFAAPRLRAFSEPDGRSDQSHQGNKE